MVDGLAAVFAGVDDDTIAIGQTLAAGDLGGCPQQVAEDGALAWVGVDHRRDVLAGNDEDVYRSLGVDVGKGVYQLIFEGGRGRNFTFDNAAEETAHGDPSVADGSKKLQGAAEVDVARQRLAPQVQAVAAGFHRPTILPSTSANQAKVPEGMGTGGTMVFPPAASTSFSDAATSSVSI